jgi:hypothetical protein
VQIPLQFEAVGRFTEGKTAVKQNGWVGIIDATGKMIVEPRFTCSVQHPMFVNGIAPAFGADEMTGYIDSTGAWSGLSSRAFTVLRAFRKVWHGRC